jgi:hypothetical protein
LFGTEESQVRKLRLGFVVDDDETSMVPPNEPLPSIKAERAVAVSSRQWTLNGGSRCLDRQEHDAIAKGTAQKPVAQIKANRVVIDGVSNDCTYTCDLRHFEASSDPIEQQVRPKPLTLVLSIDGQPADE